MISKYSIIAVGLILATVWQNSVNGGGMPLKMKCRDTEVELKDCFKGWMECAETLMDPEDVKTFKDPNASKEKKKEIGQKAHNNTCIRVCQWKKHQHLLNEDGSLNKTAQDAMIDKVFPEAARDDLKKGLSKCHEENSKAFSDEKKCESYKPFETCIRESYAKACQIDLKQIHLDKAE